jgi:dipeptidase E
MKKLLLTSDSFANPTVADAFLNLTKVTVNKKVAIVTTAAKEKDQNKYAQLTYKQMIDWGFEPSFVDFEAQADVDLTDHSIFYVCGGNTFKLLKYAKQANFGESIKQLAQRDGLYVGVSAGSLIVGPSIEIACEVKPDINDVGLTDFSGFNIVDIVIFPHYSEEYENDIAQFEGRHDLKVTRVRNGQAVLIKDRGEILIS